MELQPDVISPKGSILTICSWQAKSICSVQWYLEESPTDDLGKKSLHNSLESQGSHDPQPRRIFYLTQASLVSTCIFAFDVSEVSNQCSDHSKQRFNSVFLPLDQSKKFVTRIAKQCLRRDLRQNLDCLLRKGWTHWSMLWTGIQSRPNPTRDHGGWSIELE